MSTSVLGFAAFFLASALLVGAGQSFVMERRRVWRALRTVKAMEISRADVRRRQLAMPLPARILRPALRRLGRAGRRMTPASVVERLARELTYAGEPAGWDAERVLALKFFACALFGLTALVLGALGSLNALRILILTLGFAAAGYYLPDWVLRSRYRPRQEAIRLAMPDSLDLLSITVEAGLGFDAAVTRVAREIGGPLGEELHRVVQEMQLGRGRANALRDLAERSMVPEIKSFVLSMLQADVFGVSVSRVLHVQAQEMRVKRRQHAEEKAQKVPVKMVFPLLFCIFPSLFVVLLGPAAIRMFDSLFSSF